MAHTIKEERLRWVLPIVRGEIALGAVTKICPYGKRSLERWLAVYKKHGETGLIPHTTAPKKNPGETPIWVKECVIAKRKKIKLCAQKLHWVLEDEGVIVPVRTIGKILQQAGLTRKYRVKRVRYKYKKPSGTQESCLRLM